MQILTSAQILAADDRCYDRLDDDSAISTVQRAKRKGTMREAFPSLPFGSPTCDRRECRDKDDTDETTTTTTRTSPQSSQLNTAIRHHTATITRDAADAAAPSRGASVSPTPQNRTQLQLATSTTTTTLRQSTSSPSTSQQQLLLLSPSGIVVGGLPGSLSASVSITSPVASSFTAFARNDETAAAELSLEGIHLIAF